MKADQIALQINEYLILAADLWNKPPVIQINTLALTLPGFSV